MITDVTNIDTTGIHAMEELHKKLVSRGIEVRPKKKRSAHIVT